MAAYNQALDQADALSGAVAMADGRRCAGKRSMAKSARRGAHGTHTFLVSLVRHDSAYVLAQAVDLKTNEITVGAAPAGGA